MCSVKERITNILIFINFLKALQTGRHSETKTKRLILPFHRNYKSIRRKNTKTFVNLLHLCIRKREDTPTDN